jgi:subtilisin family serine protease
MPEIPHRAAVAGWALFRRLGRAPVGLLVGLAVLLGSATESPAQRSSNTGRSSSGGNGGSGIGAVGPILVLPAIEPRSVPAAEAVRPVGSGTVRPKPRPRAKARPPARVAIPAAAETRFVPGVVLVELKGDAAILPLARRQRLEPLARLSLRLTGTVVHRLRARDGRSTAAVLGALRREPSVAAAQPDWLYTLQQEAPPRNPPAAVAPLPGQYAAEKLHLAAAHDRSRGRDVSVALIDTGVDVGHPELAGAIAGSFEALDDGDLGPPIHGTAMAGAIAARARLSGAAPGARLLVARAFGSAGAGGVARGATSAVAKSLDWAVANRARVVSMSFAGPADGLLGRMLEAARSEGVIAVAAVGNAGPTSPPLHPAADPTVIAVTAADTDDRVLASAVHGDHVVVTAPGVDVLVPAPNGGYDLSTGTSVAAAEVAGVVALLLERRPDLTPDEVRRILTETAVDLGSQGRDPVYGAGLVDAAAALARLR